MFDLATPILAWPVSSRFFRLSLFEPLLYRSSLNQPSMIDSGDKVEKSILKRFHALIPAGNTKSQFMTILIS
jgi:hypothetical protein